MYGEHYLNVFFLVKILFSIDGSLFLHIPDVRFDIKNKIASLYSLQTKLSFWSSFIQQCASELKSTQCSRRKRDKLIWVKVNTRGFQPTYQNLYFFDFTLFRELVWFSLLHFSKYFVIKVSIKQHFINYRDTKRPSNSFSYFWF